MTEIAVAVGISSFLIMVIAAALANMTQDHMRAEAMAGAYEQRMEIHNLLMKSQRGVTASTSTCLSRLGLTGTETFDPNSSFEVSLASQLSNSTRVHLDKVLLTHAATIGTSSNATHYTTQVSAQQSITIGGKTETLQTAIVGPLNIAVDTNGHVVGCGWDITISSASEFCQNSEGVELQGTSNCQSDIELPVVTSCASGTALNSSSSTCLPANTYCYQSELGDSFDGVTIDCNTLPSDYAVRYPANYTPPQSSSDQKASACICGSSSMTPGGDQLCVKATTKSEGFGNYDDMFEVKVCNSAGQLQSADPARYFEEEGSGTKWDWKIASCRDYGGKKSEDGLWYATGKCW